MSFWYLVVGGSLELGSASVYVDLSTLHVGLDAVCRSENRHRGWAHIPGVGSQDTGSGRHKATRSESEGSVIHRATGSESEGGVRETQGHRL